MSLQSELRELSSPLVAGFLPEATIVPTGKTEPQTDGFDRGRPKQLSPVTTDSIMLTVRGGIMGRFSHTMGEPGIVCVLAGNKRGESIALVKDMLELNEGWTASKAASYVANILIIRLQTLFPLCPVGKLKVYDITKESEPLEWLIGGWGADDRRCAPVTVALSNQVMPPRPKLMPSEVKSAPLYVTAYPILRSAMERALRMA